MAEGNAPLPRRARRSRAASRPTRSQAAWWEIYAAEGSDWFWWYGPDFTIDTDLLFDELFRAPPAERLPPARRRSARASRGAHLPAQRRAQLQQAAQPHRARHVGRQRAFLRLARRGRTRPDAPGHGHVPGRPHRPAASLRLRRRTTFFLRLDLSRQPEAIIIRVLLPHAARITLRRGARTTRPRRVFETSKDGVAFTPVAVADLQVQWGNAAARGAAAARARDRARPRIRLLRPIAGRRPATRAIPRARRDRTGRAGRRFRVGAMVRLTPRPRVKIAIADLWIL